MRILLIILILFVFTGCAYKIETNVPENNEYGFILDENEANKTKIIENPTKGKARIYIYSKLNINLWNGYTGYFLSLHYGDFNKKKPYERLQDTIFLSFAKKPMATFIDIDRVDERAVIYARNLGFRETLEFIPKADNIYCIEVNAKYVPFLGLGRPYFALIDKQTCLTKAPEFFEKYATQYDSKEYSEKFWNKIKK